MKNSNAKACSNYRNSLEGKGLTYLRVRVPIDRHDSLKALCDREREEFLSQREGKGRDQK